MDVKTEEDAANYPEQPPNHSPSPPFGVVTDLFERLMKERKLQNRMKLLNAWINVRGLEIYHSIPLTNLRHRDGART